MTILETIPIFEQPGNYTWMVLTGVCAVIFFLLLVLGTQEYRLCNIIMLFACIGCLIFIIIGLILSICEPKVDTGRKRYIIRVNDNTSINEIYENYKIIDHTKYTDVYTVEELEND